MTTTSEATEKAEPVAWMHATRSDSDVITDKVKHVWGKVAVGSMAAYSIPLYTHPQPIPDGCKNDAARWNFVMATEPYALNLWNALPKNIYQQERHLNNAIDQAMLAAAPKEK